MCLSVCGCVCVCAWVLVRVYARVYVYECVRVCVGMCVCGWLYVHVCVCVRDMRMGCQLFRITQGVPYIGLNTFSPYWISLVLLNPTLL